MRQRVRMASSTVKMENGGKTCTDCNKTAQRQNVGVDCVKLSDLWRRLGDGRHGDVTAAAAAYCVVACNALSNEASRAMPHTHTHTAAWSHPIYLRTNERASESCVSPTLLDTSFCLIASAIPAAAESKQCTVVCLRNYPYCVKWHGRSQGAGSPGAHQSNPTKII